jgi:hypothetical protein
MATKQELEIMSVDVRTVEQSAGDASARRPNSTLTKNLR